jgi:hypothetical protein
MQQQDPKATGEFALFASAHAFDFLGDVGEVRSRHLSAAQQRRLLIGPGIEITIIQVAHTEPPRCAGSIDHGRGLR